MNALPKISVMIITLNEEKNIGKCLKSIDAIDYPKKLMEVVVVDNNSKDRTIEIARKFKARIVKHNEKGFAAARNIAINNAKNPVIAFTDADCIVKKQWLKELVKPLKGKVMASGGLVLIPKTTKFGYCVSAMGYPNGGIYRSLEKPGLTKELSTCNIAFKKQVFKKIGFFDSSFKFGGEDTDLILRLSKKYLLYFNPKARLYHKPRENLKDFLKWWFRRGKADVEIHKKHMPAFPRSLFSPKYFTLLHSIIVVLILIYLAIINISYFRIGLFLLGIYAFLFALKKQLKMNPVKHLLPLNAFYYWIEIPFLFYIMGLARQLGKIEGFINRKKN